MRWPAILTACLLACAMPGRQAPTIALAKDLIVIEQRPGLIRFQIDDVKPSSDPPHLLPYRKAVEARFGGGLYALSERAYSLRDPDTYGPRGAFNLKAGSEYSGNYFFATVDLAYNRHHPLVLSPDMVWLTILQGAAIHIRENSEQLRSVIKPPPRRTRLEVRVNGGQPNWGEAVRGMAAKAREQTDPKWHALFTEPFSTTGEIEEIVYAATFLDAMRNYFDYRMAGVCGFPSVTLEGSAEDWREVRRRAEQLRPLGLDWWLVKLLPILDEFARAAAGKPGREFWQSFYKDKTEYVSTVSNGHFVFLFPYIVTEQNKYIRNFMFSPEEISRRETFERGIQMHQVPPGIARVRITYIDLTQKNPDEEDLEIVAGFTGAQEKPDGTLRPEIGWLVRERGPYVPDAKP